jgi:hypothetical protein
MFTEISRLPSVTIILTILVTGKLSVYSRQTVVHELNAIVSERKLFRHERFEEILKDSMSAV